jgi:hypothetical protein
MPLTAAITGRREASKRRVRLVALPIASAPAPKPVMSAPAEKNLGPLPVMTSALQVSSASAAASPSARPLTTSPLTAFTDGWSMVSVTTAPSRSTRMTSWRT